MATLVSDKVDLWAKNITSDKEGDFIMIKGSICQEDVATLNIYELSKKASKYMKTDDISKKTDSGHNSSWKKPFEQVGW